MVNIIQHVLSFMVKVYKLHKYKNCAVKSKNRELFWK